MNWNDLYNGSASGPPTVVRATTTTGPNQSVVTGAGQVPGAVGSAPAFSWLGLVLALVLLRIIISMGGRVST